MPASRCHSAIHRITLWAIVGTLTVILTLGLSELLLRVAWSNPFLDVQKGKYKGYVKFNPAFQRQIYDASGLYEGAGLIEFQTGSYGDVLGRRNVEKPLAFFLGGSTTESRYVAEGHRWPELVTGVQARNFGVSGNTSADSYFNLKYLLEYQGLRPKVVFVMHAANDYFKHPSFTDWETEWPKVNVGERKEASDIKILLRQIYLGAFGLHMIRLLIHEGPQTVVESYVIEQRRNFRGPAVILDDEVSRYMEGPFQQFLRHRAILYTKMIELARKYGATIVLLTQPHAFSNHYRPFQGRDLRTYPILLERNLTLEQSTKVMEIINQQTRNIARQEGVQLVDLAKGMSAQDPSALFYDAIHFTRGGVKAIAGIINTEARLIRN